MASRLPPAFRRRGWIVLACVVLTLVAALVVGGDDPSYRSEAVVAVPESGGASNPTAVQPVALATTGFRRA